MDHDDRRTVVPQFRCQDYVFELAGEPELVERLETLFVDLATPPIADPHLWEIESFQAHTRVTIDGGDVGRWRLRDLCAQDVISTLSMEVIGAEPTKLHLHAAAVVDDGRSILLLAPSGSGKSTLTCALVAAGALYRTDEAVAVNRNGQGISTYPKPISVKESGIGAVERLTGLTCTPGATTWEIPASSIGTLAGDADYPVSTLVFNSYCAAQPAVVEPLHRATAVREVLSDSQDVELVGPDSLFAAAALARSANCFRATGGDAAELAQAILEAHRLPVEPGEVTIAPSPTVDAWPARGRDVSSVVVDGRAVLYTPEPYHLIELDEAQAVWWLLLDGTPFAQTIDEVVRETGESRADVLAAANAAVETFRSLGVLNEP